MRRLFASSVVLAVCSFLACGGTESSPTTTSTPDGGVAPSPADASVDAAPDAQDASTYDANVPCADCLTEGFTWGPNGGNVIYFDESSLASCRTFARHRVSYVDSGPLPSCTDELGSCDAGPVAVGDVERALAHPDVIKAFAAATTPVYGTDSRPVDGAVLRVTKGGKSIDIGGDCPSPAGTCVPIPAGVKTLAAVLRDLDKQEIAKPACVGFQ